MTFVWLIAVITVIFLIYLWIGTQLEREHFLIDPENVSLYQGQSFPLDSNDVQGYAPKGSELPAVTEDPDAPKSMFVFSYNDCKPECCKTSPYGCNGTGCVCIDDKKQLEFLASRGGNSHYGSACCSPAEEGPLVNRCKSSCGKKEKDNSMRGLGFVDYSPAIPQY